MLQIIIPRTELFNDHTQEFFNIGPQSLQLEHSLVSLSKWESKWQKPFLSKEDKTEEESLDYVRCMTISQNIHPDTYACITPALMQEIIAYIQAPMTATTFTKDDSRKINREVITAEIIYYWMIVHNIPFECQKWHLNKLLTLINVCNIKNQSPKKMSKRDLASRNQAINAARRRNLNTTG
jgi:hypothetical protein